MGRVINTSSTGKERNQQRRTIAEILRHLSKKESIDEEAKDMVAAIVFNLRGIEAGIDTSAEAWEKRDYWMKAEGLRKEWFWVGYLADQLTQMIYADEWEKLPQMMVQLIPKFADININKFTRTSDEWDGAHERLLDEKPNR